MAHEEYPRLYCQQMAAVKERLALIRRFPSQELTLGSDYFDYECVSLHFRKILESIAFAALCANKVAYQEAHAGFAADWNAKRLLARLAVIHPAFYPTPMTLERQAERHVLLTPVARGFLTQGEFVRLYDTCSSVLHTWNPFTDRVRHVDFGYSVAQWCDRIVRLLDVHCMQPAGSKDRWVIRMNDATDGHVHAQVLSPQEESK